MFPATNFSCEEVTLFKFSTVLINYLLSTGESYGPTAQHTQDSPIFFIQLNYVYKTKE